MRGIGISGVTDDLADGNVGTPQGLAGFGHAGILDQPGKGLSGIVLNDPGHLPFAVIKKICQFL